MLEIKNLCKTYKPKKGVAVTALDHVSLSFPERGMVFLLGKSGSGKSTLLNLLGGLDVCDSGEIIIKGTSSASFSQKHFDSYRNTYLGFIFQEYNVLEDFSVGANIALAIELQGKKAGDEELNDILHKVDLDGYGNRKPNELSGGQKQRVAIARALVKNPDIIMADEPTGALDSATGKQVLDTLKKLSREKLVIVVSHDRDFAEKYADRIIELSDGRVISDMEYAETDSSDAASLSFEEGTVSIPQGYHLTEEDRAAINAYIDSIQSGVKLAPSFRRRTAKPTEKREAVNTSSPSSFHLIKSRLSLKHAFKIGASGLKHKKIRLAVTILLSCVAFGLFGLSDTFGAYDHVRTCTRSILDTGVSYASVEKTVKVGKGINSYYRSGYALTQKDLDAFEKETGVRLEGVYEQRNSELGFVDRIAKTEELSNENHVSIYPLAFSGYSEIDSDVLNQMGYSLLCGRIPDGNKNEIAVSEYVASSFIKAGFLNAETGETEKIKDQKDLLNKTLTLDGEEFEIVGVIDTHFDFDRYLPLMENKENQTTAEELIDFALTNEMMYVRNYSLMQAAMVGEGFVKNRVAALPNTERISQGWMWFYGDTDQNEDWLSLDPYYIGTLEENKVDILWLDGEKSALAEKELVISSDLIANGGNSLISKDSDTYLEDCLERLSRFQSFTFSGGIYNAEDDSIRGDEVSGYRVVGIIDSRENRNFAETILADSAMKKDFAFTDSEQGIYQYAVGAMPKEKSGVQKLVSYCYNENSDIRYPLLNSVTYELDTVNSVLKVLSEVFFWIGVGFAVFASIMLANFISTSISYKKQEIGILRAIGARGNDVFRIFFSESFIIAMINFVLSSAGVAAATFLVNFLIRNEAGILITLLSFGIRQIALLFVISVLVAAIASFIPVKRIASKRPIDAIRNR